MAVGVPEIAPVEESMERPEGSDGETDHDVTAPPLEVGVTVVMAVFLTNDSELGLYVRDGRRSDIVDRDGDRSRGAAAGVAGRDRVGRRRRDGRWGS